MLCCNSMLCVSHWLKKLLPCCSALWLATLLAYSIQTRTSLAPLYAHLMCLTGFRFDILNVVWVSVYTYSSYWLFVACFKMDTVLQQLICHDMFLLCTTSQIPLVVRSNLWSGKVLEMAPSVEHWPFIILFLFYHNLFVLLEVCKCITCM